MFNGVAAEGSVSTQDLLGNFRSNICYRGLI